MADRTSIGSIGGFKSGVRSSVGSDTGFKSNDRASTSSNHMSFMSAAPAPPTADTFGGSNLEAKRKFVDDYYESTITMENVEELGGVVRKFLREDLPNAAKGTVKTVVNGLTPGFIKRFRNKKIYAQEVEEREA